MQHPNNNAGALPPPLKPPDGGGGLRQTHVSFRDKLLGAQTPLPRREKIDLLAKNLFRIEYEGGDRLKPKCYVADSILEELWTPWKDAVIVTLLGKSLGYMTMKDRLTSAWRLTGGLDMIDIGSGYFLVKFDVAADREKVICEGPWMIFDHYVAVRPWTPDFIASEVKIKTTMVWVRFPFLGMEYYDESVLMALGTAVGKPVKVDIRTIDASRGKFARVCVEINLEEPVVGRVWFRDRWFNVQYEGLHLLCKDCGLYGHVSRNCAKKIPSETLVAAATGGDPLVNAAKTTHAATVDAARNPTGTANLAENSDEIVIESDVNSQLDGWGPLHHESLVVVKKKQVKAAVKPLATRGAKPASTTNKFAALTNTHNEGISETVAGILDHAVIGATFHVGGTSHQGDKVWKKKNKRQRHEMVHQQRTEPKQKGIVIGDGPTSNNPPPAQGKVTIMGKGTSISSFGSTPAPHALDPSRVDAAVNREEPSKCGDPPDSMLAQRHPPDPQDTRRLADHQMLGVIIPSEEDMDEAVDETPEMLQA